MSDVNPNLQTIEDELAGVENADKYRGKSVADVAKMHQEAEKKASRIGNELGQLRTVADTLMALQQKQVETKAIEERKPMTVDDLLAEPDKVIDTAVSTNEVVEQTVSKVDQLEKQLGLQTLERSFPDYKQYVADPKFAEWIKTNPTRLRLFAQADSHDYGAAAELFALWQERTQLTQQAVDNSEKAERKVKERAGTLEGASGASADTKVLYDREAGIALHRRALAGDPVARAKWYSKDYQDARSQAFAEGRVTKLS